MVVLDVFKSLLQILIRNEPKETSSKITGSARKLALNIKNIALETEPSDVAQWKILWNRDELNLFSTREKSRRSKILIGT
ncbi:hypothetical protein [Paenibacillus sp. N3.4]|uniref:hypothetical protein n=1 Tax=Paenibacillus sp. N3.4 TaxID=2603222 RepID=UPI0011CAB49B|nr:hypothetical protein [Paenibacillus sp. N3.4]TXK83559.1 hypothetical protein FU659_13375 [Paenibacillus sp. N3.4]